MNTINCRIKINDFADVAGEGVTPAEVILLRSIHDAQAGGCCIKNAVPAGVAMTRIGGKQVVKIMEDSEGNEVEVRVDDPLLRERTDAEEIARLRAKYSVRAKSGAPGSHIVEDVFGGAGVIAKLPQTFAELPGKYAVTLFAPVQQPVNLDPAPTPASPAPPAATPVDFPTAETMSKMKRDELLKLAELAGIPPQEAEKLKKAQLVERLTPKT